MPNYIGRKKFPWVVLAGMKSTHILLDPGFAKASCYDNHLSNTELSQTLM